MKRILTSLLFCFVLVVNAQKIQVVEEGVITIDSISLHKSTEIDQERTFSTDLKEKYSGKDFEYKEDVKKKEADKNEDTNKSINAFLAFFIFFMTSIFPFLLGGFVIFVIVKVLLGSDIRFWQSNPKSKKLSEKLVYEDEDIHEINLDALLLQAIEKKDFRLAIRYYYLSALKSLSKKQLIDYHKDKTNSEYLFELENKNLRTEFSYLSYVYSYVWYGEFPVDETNFKVAENKYQSFLKSIV